MRDATRPDLDDVAAIYGHHALHSIATFDLEPRPVATWERWWRERVVDGEYHLLVAELDDRVVGYATSDQFNVKPGYVTSVTTSVYVAADVVARGVGTALYQELFARLEAADFHRAYAGIAQPNPASVALHERFGFRHVATYTEVGRKLGRWIDVTWYERPVPLSG